MLSTDSLPRKWSILNIWDSSNTACTAAFNACAEARSTPNGFSTITRASAVASPDEPSIPTTDANATGGTARWNSRPTGPGDREPPCEAPMAASAAATAFTSGDGSSVDAAPNDRCDANFSHASPTGLATPQSWHASSACDRKSASDSANSGGDDPMTANFSGSSPATYR